MIQPLKYITLTTGTYTGSVYEGFNQRRLVADVLTHTGSLSLRLQGSNAQSASYATPDTWHDVENCTITIAGEDDDGEYDVLFRDQHKFYRYVAVVNGTFTFNANAVESIWDDAIAYGAFALIFADFMKKDNDDDIWNVRRKFAEQNYERILAQNKFLYDKNSSGIIDELETDVQMTYIELSR